jgi:hypothetical protein
MKTFARLLLATTLACATATAASAYHLSPPDISARLRGTLTFTPDEGGSKPFHCKVTLYLKTKGIIKAATVDSPGGCHGLIFGNLPWFVGVNSATSGEFGIVDFTSSAGTGIQDSVQFQDNSSGVWSLPPGQIMSGTLTSRPPVTIVP